MASEQLKKVLDIAKLQQIGGASEPTIEQLRAGIEKVAERVASDVHCEPVMAGDVKAEWIVPPEADAERTLLYFHGGGYVMGSINTHTGDGGPYGARRPRAGACDRLSTCAGASVSSGGRRRDGRV